ncbi:MAG: hypothetical protein ACM3NH_04855 [Candidatus Saccharibacteria bacterium]
MNLKDFFGLSLLRWVLGGIAIIIVLLLVLQLGIMIGTHKAKFSYRWAEEYGRNFGSPRAGLMPDFGERDFFGGHGLAGSVVKTEGSRVIIKGDDDKEKIVDTDDKTVIRRSRTDIKVSDLKTDEQVVVVGAPNNDGSIQARIIRIMDINDLPPLMPKPFMGEPR